VKKRSKDHAERERRADRAEAGLVPADAREARGPSAEAARAVNPPSPRPRQAEAAFRKEAAGAHRDARTHALIASPPLL